MTAVLVITLQCKPVLDISFAASASVLGQALHELALCTRSTLEALREPLFTLSSPALEHSLPELWQDWLRQKARPGAVAQQRHCRHVTNTAAAMLQRLSCRADAGLQWQSKLLHAEALSLKAVDAVWPFGGWVTI